MSKRKVTYVEGVLDGTINKWDAERESHTAQLLSFCLGPDHSFRSKGPRRCPKVRLVPFGEFENFGFKGIDGLPVI